MSFKAFLIPAVLLSILYGFVMTSVASAEITFTVSNWEAECALVDEMVECDIHSDYGISNVSVFMNSGIGPVEIFDEDYEGCPTDVHVSLDPMVLKESSEMQVSTCGVVNPCDDCTIEICIVDVTCLPDVGVGQPDPLPLKNTTEQPQSRFVPIVLSSKDTSPR